MKKLFGISVLSICTGLCHAQVEIPLSFTSEEDNKIVKETDSGKYYKASGGDERTVFLSEDMLYKLYDKDNKVLTEGAVSNDGDKFLREGKWTEFYTNGTIKSTGHYYKDNPVGTWIKYYPGNKLKQICSYALIENGSTHYCMSGTYEEYFDNGHLKTSGLYKAVFDDRAKDTIYVQDPETGKQIKKIVTNSRPRPEKFGTWEYYNESGDLIKKDEL
jgi:antitoxin component YwqK of YwqJK toxin-antitoxin module